MDTKRLLAQAIIPALKGLEDHGIRDSFEARRFLLAIALQESGAKYRRQINNAGEPVGPAASYWQFEQGGGCVGVLTHASVEKRMKAVLAANDIGDTSKELWEAMRYHDIVAATAARLLVYTLPNSLPTNANDGWAQYLKAWRPGKPHPNKWPNCWTTADAVCRAVEV